MRITTKYLSMLMLVAVLLSSAAGAFAAPPPQQGYDLREMAQVLIKNNVGMIVGLKDTGSADPPIIIIQEFHKSILGNIETAVILNRLYEQYGTQHIGIEGAFGVLDASWFHQLAPGPISDAVAVQHLAEGEISNAELMALARPQIAVIGLEDENEYTTNLQQSEAISAAVPILIVFATSQMTPEQLTAADTIRAEQGVQAYIDHCLNYDIWSKEHYETLYFDGTTSAEEAYESVEEISDRAFALGLDQIPELAPYLENLQNELAYYHGVDQRTYTMVENALALAREHPDAPFPIVTGLAHAARMRELVEEAGFSYILVQAQSLQTALTETNPIGTMSAEAYDRKATLQSVDEPGLLGALLDGRSQIRPEPVINEVFYERKAASYIAFEQLSDYLRSHPDLGVGSPAPADLQGLLTELTQMGVQVDPATVQVVRADPASPDSVNNRALLVQITLPEVTQNGILYPTVQYWAKVTFTDNSTDPDTLRQKTLEELLLEARENVQNQTTSQPGVINVTPDTLAVIATDQQATVAQTVKSGS